MLAAVILLAATIGQSDVPPVPGLCTAPVPADPDTPGCYRTGTLDLLATPTELFWHIREYPTTAEAETEARRHRAATVAQAHSRVWLYVLGEANEHIIGGTKRASIGPLRRPAGPARAHFAEAVFPPGMRTRVHSHPGPEAFYVVEGEQCMESPTDRKRIEAGGTYVVESGLHLQAAPRGRRNLVLILAPNDRPVIVPGGDWQPTDYCDR